MRGTPNIIATAIVGLGIIPAHAGNTVGFPPMVRHNRDHPRACGEHDFSSLNSTKKRGSSPRMRGTRIVEIQQLEALGIIPAHAGNTQSFALALACPEGSSPRMRGTLSEKPWSLSHSRIIPAHAGNTHDSVSSIASKRDHPRACGEHLLKLGQLARL